MAVATGTIRPARVPVVWLVAAVAAVVVAAVAGVAIGAVALSPGKVVLALVDHVPGVHRPSVTLACLTVRDPVERGLDLGTGNGVEAILMARHARHVVASDVNARAIEFARFNGILNHAPAIDWRFFSSAAIN